MIKKQLSKIKKFLANSIPNVGRRKIKSLLAIFILFLIWQPLRLLVPMLDMHPAFAYIFSVLEIRKTHEDTARLGKLRIRATLIGSLTAILMLYVNSYFSSLTEVGYVRLSFEIALILIGVLLSLSVSQMAKCDSMCGIAAAVFIICAVWHNSGDVYMYALFRALQTILGVATAYLLNKYTFNTACAETELSASPNSERSEL